MGLEWLADEGEVHMAPPPGESLTPCCNLGLDELPSDKDRVTTLPDEVTCAVSWRGRSVPAPSLLMAAMKGGKLEGSLERLLKVRARLIRASSSEINSGLRDELLRLLDRGE